MLYLNHKREKEIIKMFELVYYYEGGDEREVIGVFNTMEEVKERVENDGWNGYCIDWSEEGYEINEL